MFKKFAIGRWIAALAVTFTAAAGLVATSAPAHADTYVRGCHASGAWNYSPAFNARKLTSVTFTSSGPINNCISLPGGALSVTGTYTLSGSGNVSCVDPGSSLSFTLTIQWSDGTKSVINESATALQAGGTGIYNGSVTSGALAGRTVQSTVLADANFLSTCLKGTVSILNNTFGVIID